MRFDYFFSLPPSVDMVSPPPHPPPEACVKISSWCFETQPECPSKTANIFLVAFLKSLLLDLALVDNEDWHSSGVELRLVSSPAADVKRSGRKLWSHCTEHPGCICLWCRKDFILSSVTPFFQKCYIHACRTLWISVITCMPQWPLIAVDHSSPYFWRGDLMMALHNNPSYPSQGLVCFPPCWNHEIIPFFPNLCWKVLCGTRLLCLHPAWRLVTAP